VFALAEDVRHLYDVRSSGNSILRYSAAQLMTRQEEIKKFSISMGLAFFVLAALGVINKPRRSLNICAGWGL